MKYITETLDFKLDGSNIITLGKFDGLHKGHQRLIERVIELGEKQEETVVFTFDVPPIEIIKGARYQTLLTNKERKKMIEAAGIDCLIECPFAPEIMNMEPEAFVEEILVKQLNISGAVIGADFHFGHNRQGNPLILEALGKRYGFSVEVLDKISDGEREISSTYIREEIIKGNIAKSNELLGYPYFITGEVIRGQQLGSTIGMPTINQIPETTKQLPPFGVYTSTTLIGGRYYQSVSNIGVKPTVGSEVVGIETYLFDCDEDLYGLEAKVSLLHFQRSEQKFISLAALQAQLVKDKEIARKFSS